MIYMEVAQVFEDSGCSGVVKFPGHRKILQNGQGAPVVGLGLLVTEFGLEELGSVDVVQGRTPGSTLSAAAGLFRRRLPGPGEPPRLSELIEYGQRPLADRPGIRKIA